MHSTAELLANVRHGIKSKEELEYFLIHQNRYRFILEQIAKVNLPVGAKILDVGCYPLHLFRALELAGYEVLGVSSKHESVKSEKIISINIETDTLPFNKDFFDLILFSEVMEHLLYNPMVYLDKFKKVLREGGYLLITTPNAVHLKHRLESVVGKSPYYPLFQMIEAESGNDHVYHRHNREYTLEEIISLLSESSFKIVASSYFAAYNPWREKLRSDSIPVKMGKGLVFASAMLHGTFKDSIFVLAQNK